MASSIGWMTESNFPTTGILCGTCARTLNTDPNMLSNIGHNTLKSQQTIPLMK